MPSTYDKWLPSILNLALFYDMGLVYGIERSEKTIIRDIKALSNDKFV